MAYRINRNTEIVIGHEGEKGFREVRFDVSELPKGIIYLEHLRYGDTYAYPIRLERVGDEAIWIPNETDTAKRGTGRGQLVCYDGDEIVAKTDVFKMINRYSLATTDEVPDGYDSWIQRLGTLGADIEGKTTDGLNAINEAKDSALDSISTVSADGIEAITEAKTDSLDAIEQKKEAVHTELDVYVEAHHDELKGEKGDKGEQGDDYIITEADKQEIADEVESKYVTELGEIRETVSHKAEATDLALANRKIKALTDVLNGKELAFETNDYESAKVDVPSGAVADSVLKIGGKSVVVDGELMSSQTDAVEVYKADKTLDKQIPTNLPILRSAGSVHDSVEGGKLIRRVGEVDLGTLRWSWYATLNAFTAPRPSDCAALRTNAKPNFSAEKYETIAYKSAINLETYTNIICGTNSGNIVVKTNGTSTVTPIGLLYYELAEPIIEDLSLPADLEAINVEAGGEVSFIDHSDMDFSIPSTHEFIVRNSEV